ncbi:hypothetical protein [Stieleria magnilauensis]|uniref:hypothetical protein n=1 Tax=Stieleria magnilauensis TaxID=2527963 RepID=UPI003AF830A2
MLREVIRGGNQRCNQENTGILTAPLTGLMIAEMAVGDEPSFPLEPFMLSRLPAEAAGNPSSVYSRSICRVTDQVSKSFLERLTDAPVQLRSRNRSSLRKLPSVVVAARWLRNRDQGFRF